MKQVKRKKGRILPSFLLASVGEAGNKEGQKERRKEGSRGSRE